MPITASEIETLLRDAFPDAQIKVQGDDGSHFAAEVIDTSFKGKNRVQQQRAVYGAMHRKPRVAVARDFCLRWTRRSLRRRNENPRRRVLLSVRPETHREPKFRLLCLCWAGTLPNSVSHTHRTLPSHRHLYIS